MALQTIPNDVQVQGTLSAQNIKYPSQQITDAAVQALAGIQSSKLQHRREPVYAQGSGVTAAAATQVIHVLYGTTGAVVAFRAGSIAANVGAATVTVDLKRSGTSLLSGAITLSSSTAARALVVATIATIALAAGDVLEVVITAMAGGGTLAQGVFAQLVVDEDAQ